MRSGALGVFDWIVIAGYALTVLGVGVWATRRSDTSDDYFLAGRSLPWVVVGASLFATNMSGSTLVGLVGGAYQMGLAVYNYEWTAVVALLALMVLFLPAYRRLNITTAPEFLERRFDVRTRRCFSALALVGNVLIDMAGALYAGAIFVNVVIPALSLETCVVLLALMAGGYAVAGGMRAAVYTDVLQGILLMLGAGCVTAVAYGEVGGWDAVVAATEPNMRRLILPAGNDVLPWPGLVTGLALLGIYYWCINQVMVQRALSARSLQQARHGALLAGFLKLPVLVVLVMPGLFALVLYPNLGNPDLVFPKLTLELLPTGVRGFILVAFIAAVMSSVDSVLNSASALVTMDFYATFRPQASEERLVLVGRIVAVVILVLGAVVAPQIQQFPSLWTYLQSALSYLSPPIVAVFAGGLFGPRVNRQGAFWTLAIGSALGGLLLVVQPALHFLYVAALLFVASVGMMMGVSYATAPPPQRKVAACLWRQTDAHLSRGTLRIVVVLLLAVALIVGALW
ncbi:MAG TPA: sodium:solute symporter [Salinibacter sp.]|nr:sodium:solute symporter [Salinibacter sp.]